MQPFSLVDFPDADRQRFNKKLRNFLDDHMMSEVPTLVLQYSPVQASIVDIGDKNVRDALLGGTGLNSQTWWDGFMGSSACVPVFDGLASGRRDQEERWATEIHEDGHILAAIRADDESEKRPVYIFLSAVFADFDRLVQRLQSAAGIKGAVQLTATLVNGKGLQLVNDRAYVSNGRRVIARDVLEWPVVSAVGDAALTKACQQMANRFERLFP